MKNYDVIWIGTGQATGTVIPHLVDAGKRVAVIDGGRVGGTCVNFGCTPTKTLVASARAAHMARRGADFGVRISEMSVDFSKVMERQNDIRNRNSQKMEEWLSNLDNIDLYRQHARFENAHTVRMGEDLLSGETIVIHVGARARTPEIPGLENVPWLDNVRLLDLTEKPQHLVCIGGSYISLEFAQAFRRFGCKVTVLERGPQLMFREDADIAILAQEILEKEGIDVRLNVSIQRVGTVDTNNVEVIFEQEGQATSVRGSHLLVAAGRVPCSDGLGLDAAGVEVNERGYISVNEYMQTNVPHIYALGDVNGEGAFTHTSVHDGEIFWDQYASPEYGSLSGRKLSDRVTTYAMYIDPPLGRVGMNEKEARKSGRNVLMATRPMARISRAVEKDETDGLVKIVVDSDTEEFLGATILGVGGDEVINLFTTFMYTGMSYKVFRRAMLNHPTIAELMPFILDDLQPLDS